MVASVSVFVIIPVFVVMIAEIALSIPQKAVYIFAAMSLISDIVMFGVVRKKATGAKILIYSLMVFLTVISIIMMMAINGSLS